MLCATNFTITKTNRFENVKKKKCSSTSSVRKKKVES